MVEPILIAIAIMWLPVALMFLGYGEPKGTGAATGFVGVLVVVCAILQAAVFKDGYTCGLLFVHGLFYCCVSYALLTGMEDLRSVGNVSLTTALASVVYMILFFTGSKAADGTVIIGQSMYLALACAGYAALTFMVWLNAHGKFPAKVLAWSLIIWVVVGLWIPAFSLLASKGLPF